MLFHMTSKSIQREHKIQEPALEGPFFFYYYNITYQITFFVVREVCFSNLIPTYFPTTMKDFMAKSKEDKLSSKHLPA